MRPDGWEGARVQGMPRFGLSKAPQQTRRHITAVTGTVTMIGTVTAEFAESCEGSGKVSCRKCGI